MNNTDSPEHPGIWSANTVQEWLPSDSKELFEKNIKNSNFADTADKYGPQHDLLTYRLNSNGFRGDNFDSSVKNILTLGCSYTFGIGLREHESWPYILAQALNLHVHNISWPGRSNDYCFRMAEYWIPRLNPHMVVMLAPPPVRAELKVSTTERNQYMTFLPSQVQLTDQDFYLKNWFANQSNAEINSRKNKLAIEAICIKSNIKFLWYNNTALCRDFFRKKTDNDYARDFQHPGTTYHENFVQQVLKDLND